MNIQLVSVMQRSISAEQWVGKMNQKIQDLQLIGVNMRMRPMGIRGIRLGSSEEEFSLRIQGHDLDKLIELESRN